MSIAKRLHLPYPVRRYVDHPDVRAHILEIEHISYERFEKRLGLRDLQKIVRSLEAWIDGVRTKDANTGKTVWRERPSLRTIELLLTVQGRLPRGKENQAPSVYNNPQFNQLHFDRADAKAAMALLRQERERQEKARAIELDPGAIEREGGETDERPPAILLRGGAPRADVRAVPRAVWRPSISVTTRSAPSAITFSPSTLTRSGPRLATC